MQVITKARTFLLCFFNISITKYHYQYDNYNVWHFRIWLWLTTMTYNLLASMGMPGGTSFNPLLIHFTSGPINDIDGSHWQGAGQAPVVMSKNTVLSKVVKKMKEMTLTKRFLKLNSIPWLKKTIDIRTKCASSSSSKTVQNCARSIKDWSHDMFNHCA